MNRPKWRESLHILYTDTFVYICLSDAIVDIITKDSNLVTVYSKYYTKYKKKVLLIARGEV